MPGVLRCRDCGTKLRYETPTAPARARCPKCKRVFAPSLPPLPLTLGELQEESSDRFMAGGPPRPCKQQKAFYSRSIEIPKRIQRAAIALFIIAMVLVAIVVGFVSPAEDRAGAEAPTLTGKDNGYVWQAAGYETRVNLCTDLARRIDKPGLDWKFYYGALETFYDTSDPQILHVSIAELAGMATAVRRGLE